MDQWIRVIDSLPNPGQVVLIASKQIETGIVRVNVACYKSAIDWTTGNDMVDDELYFGERKVTHWMPLPEPPKED